MTDFSDAFRWYEEFLRVLQVSREMSEAIRLEREIRESSRVEEAIQLERETQRILEPFRQYSAMADLMATRLSISLIAVGDSARETAEGMAEIGRPARELAERMTEIGRPARELAERMTEALRPGLEAAGVPSLDFDEIGREVATSLTTIESDESGTVTFEQVVVLIIVVVGRVAPSFVSSATDVIKWVFPVALALFLFAVSDHQQRADHQEVIGRFSGLDRDHEVLQNAFEGLLMAIYPPTHRLSRGALRLHVEPDAGADFLRKIAEGEAVCVLEERGAWAKVAEVDEETGTLRSGWIYRKYLKPIQ